MADRVEREIEEILRKIDNLAPGTKPRSSGKAKQPSPPRQTRPFGVAQGWLGHRLARISLRQVMMWSVFAVILAFFVRSIPGANWIMIGGLIVFVTAYLLSRTQGGSARSASKRWRGEVIDYNGPGLADQIKAWVKRRKRS